MCYSGAARKAEIGTPEQSSLGGAGPQWAGVRVGEYEVGGRNAPLVNEASRSGSREGGSAKPDGKLGEQVWVWK